MRCFVKLIPGAVVVLAEYMKKKLFLMGFFFLAFEVFRWVWSKSICFCFGYDSLQLSREYPAQVFLKNTAGSNLFYVEMSFP